MRLGWRRRVRLWKRPLRFLLDDSVPHDVGCGTHRRKGPAVKEHIKQLVEHWDQDRDDGWLDVNGMVEAILGELVAVLDRIDREAREKQTRMGFVAYEQLSEIIEKIRVEAGV